MKGLNICIFAPVCFNSFKASRIHELKTVRDAVFCMKFEVLGILIKNSLEYFI